MNDNKAMYVNGSTTRGQQSSNPEKAPAKSVSRELMARFHLHFDRETISQSDFLAK